MAPLGLPARGLLCLSALLHASAAPAAGPTALLQQQAAPAAGPTTPRQQQADVASPAPQTNSDLFHALSDARLEALRALFLRMTDYVQNFTAVWGIPGPVALSHNHSYSDPGFKTASEDQEEEVKTFFAEVVRAFPKSQEAFIDSIQGIGMGSDVTDMYTKAVGGHVLAMRKPFSAWDDFFEDGAHTADVKAGGGFGFGFQVYCGCHQILSTGMGFGSGLDAHNRGGFGGGGGLQLFQAGEQRATLGGGGGGDLADVFGTSEDDGQAPQSGTVGDVRDKLLAPQISACPKDKLSVTGGGGAGLGLAITIGDGLTQYGGGLDFKMASENFDLNDLECGGSISRETQQDHNLDDEQKQCRAKCLEDPSTFNGCFCTCTRQAYLKAGNDWAKHMKCTGSLRAGAVVVV